MDKIIQDFCKDAESVSINTSKVECLGNCVLNIDYKKDEIKRTRYNTSLDCYFNMELKLADNITLDEEIEIMRTIETYYNDTFNWRFNGEHIECYAFIPMKTENLGIYSRFRGIYGFIKALREQLVKICKYRGNNAYYIPKLIDNMIISNGSINMKTELFVIPINPYDEKFEILSNSKSRIIPEENINILQMRYWVREINPDFERELLPERKEKMELTDNIFDSYPPCIKAIAALPRKGNYARFLLASYLLSVHKERDAKHQMLLMLSDDEREHLENGNCKDQWRAIVSRNYPSPSCKKMIENGFCSENCGRPKPSYSLEVKKDEGNNMA